jgi:hypothetical protein
MVERKKRPRPITAAELIAQRAADPEYRAKRAKEDAVLEAQATIWRHAQRPLLYDLRAAGYEVDDVWDLVNTSTSYPDALPVLLEHLQRDYPDAIRDGIARALAVRSAAFGWSVLREQYVACSQPRTKQGLAAALARIVTRDKLCELIELLHDASHGESRVILLTGLTRFRTPKVRAELEALASDPQFALEVAHRLKRRKT